MLYWDDQMQPPGLVFYLLDNSFAQCHNCRLPQGCQVSRQQ